MLEQRLSRFIEWLSYQPSPSDICRALVTEYASDLTPHSARLSKLNIDDSLTFIGEYGFQSDEQVLGKTLSSQDWRREDPVAKLMSTQGSFAGWTEDGELSIFSLRDRGVVQGFLALRFLGPVTNFDLRQRTENYLLMYLLPLSLYLSFLNRMSMAGSQKTNPTFEIFPSNNNSQIRLTQRQRQVLRGMVEGKTNHDMAIELGYSVSTIRHETMAIYKELAVSDRHEAARVAISRGLVS